MVRRFAGRLAVLLMLAGSVQASQGTAQDHFNRGLALFEQDELKKAEKEFKKAQKADRNWAEPVFYLGLCAHSRDDLKKAKRYYRETLALSPGHEDAAYWLHTIEEAEKLRKARSHLEKGRFEKVADELVAYVRRGGELDAALSSLHRPEYIGERFALPLFRAFDERGRLDLAAQLVEWAAQSTEDRIAVESMRGVLHLRNDDEEQARQVCDALLAEAGQPGFLLSDFNGQLFDHFGISHEHPKILEQKFPSYTDEGIAYRIQGTVVLRGVIGLDGRFSDAEVLKGLGYGLDEAAVRSIVRDWVFKPAQLNGKPVARVGVIEISFRLGS